MGYVLYKWTPGWGLPSLSAACIQVEALLRFAGLEDVFAEPSRLPGSSPTDLGSGDEGEFEAMRSIMQYIKAKGDDVDAHLTNAQRGELAGMVALVQMTLEPATLYTTWVEKEGFSKYRHAYSGSLPWPLNYVVAWEARRAVRKKFQGTTSEKVFKDAAETVENIADFLVGQQSKGCFCFGDQPSSLDAIIYGHLQYYRLAPVTAPVLQRKVESNEVLVRYLDGISTKFFQQDAPPRPPRTLPEDLDGEVSSTWSSAAQGRSREEPRATDEETAENLHLKKTAKWWLLFAGVMVTAYAFYHPPPISVQYSDAVLDDEDDDDVEG